LVEFGEHDGRGRSIRLTLNGRAAAAHLQ
jgi:hypothetical protein